MANTSEVGQGDFGEVEEGIDLEVGHGFMAVRSQGLGGLVVMLNSLQAKYKIDFKYIGPANLADPESVGYEALVEVWK